MEHQTNERAATSNSSGPRRRPTARNPAADTVNEHIPYQSGVELAAPQS